MSFLRRKCELRRYEWSGEEIQYNIIQGIYVKQITWIEIRISEMIDMNLQSFCDNIINKEFGQRKDKRVKKCHGCIANTDSRFFRLKQKGFGIPEAALTIFKFFCSAWNSGNLSRWNFQGDPNTKARVAHILLMSLCVYALFRGISTAAAASVCSISSSWSVSSTRNDEEKFL